MKFEAINEKEFLNPYHRKKPILETELNEFIKTLKKFRKQSQKQRRFPCGKRS